MLEEKAEYLRCYDLVGRLNNAFLIRYGGALEYMGQLWWGVVEKPN